MELPSCPIVDEKSMIGLQLLAIIEQRCRETVPHLLAVAHWMAQSLCSSYTNILIKERQRSSPRYYIINSKLVSLGSTSTVVRCQEGTDAQFVNYVGNL